MLSNIAKFAVGAVVVAGASYVGYKGYKAYQRRKLAARKPSALLGGPSPAALIVEAPVDPLDVLGDSVEIECALIGKIEALDVELDQLEAEIAKRGAAMGVPGSAAYVEFQAWILEAAQQYQALYTQRQELYCQWAQLSSSTTASAAA